MLVMSAAMCLALNVYHEARGEFIPGQYAVALVTVNRAGWDRNRICEEVFRPRQFSWANTHVAAVPGGWWVRAPLKPRDEQAWWLASRVAQVVLAGRMADFTQGATHYHAKTVAPSWRTAFQPLRRKLGNHVFYRTRRVSQR